MTELATDNIYRAFRSANADPDLAHAAVAQVREIAGENVVTAIRSDITELRAELHGEVRELRAELQGEVRELQGEMREMRAELQGEMREMRAELQGEIRELHSGMREMHAEIRAIDRRIDTLARVIWPLVTGFLLVVAAGVFAILTGP